MEATDREDIGANLRAPDFDESGNENWRYTLFKAAKVGDIVLHYDGRTEPNGIVGWSTIARTRRTEQITWAARGSYARDKGIKPRERAGYVIPLAG
jgi:predicted RNA-binding protein with PUA-like domain